MAAKKEKIRAWLIKRQKIIEGLSQKLGIVYDDVNGCWRIYRDGNFIPVEIDDAMRDGEFEADFRRLVAEGNYYQGALDLCSACDIEY